MTKHRYMLEFDTSKGAPTPHAFLETLGTLVTSDTDKIVERYGSALGSLLGSNWTLTDRNFKTAGGHATGAGSNDGGFGQTVHADTPPAPKPEADPARLIPYDFKVTVELAEECDDAHLLMLVAMALTDIGKTRGIEIVGGGAKPDPVKMRVGCLYGPMNAKRPEPIPVLNWQVECTQVGGRPTLMSLGDFFDDSSIGEHEAAEIAATVALGLTYTGGGGAQPLWTLKRVDA